MIRSVTVEAVTHTALHIIPRSGAALKLLHFLSVAIQHACVVEVKLRVLDTGKTSVAATFDDNDVLGLVGDI